MSRSFGSAGAIARQVEQIELIAHATPAPSAALQRIANAARKLGRFVNTTADTPALEPLAGELEELLARLPDAGGPSRFLSEADLDPQRPLPNPRGTHPLLGCVNPVAPPLALRVEGEQVVADVEFDVAYEGNRGWVHGGFVAAGFDIAVVTAARLSGRAGPTGTLRVRFAAPTPVGQPLRYVAWPEAVEGRRVHVRARLERADDGFVTADAEGIVVTPRDFPQQPDRGGEPRV
jgi:acyl-coenzyme A thioesterase PaaI-like protein